MRVVFCLGRCWFRRLGLNFIHSQNEHELNDRPPCARCLKFCASCFTIHLHTTKQIEKMAKTRIALIALSLIGFLFSCTEIEKSVTLAPDLKDKKITMTSSSVEGLSVVIYLITVDPVEGEMLAKAMNAEGKEIGRAKQMLALGKDESKLVTFTFGAELNLDQVVRYMIDFRKQ